jgi:hypothetical protein
MIAVLLAFATALMLNQNNLINVRYFFRTPSSIGKELLRTIDQFNKLYASFYVTGGNSPGLNEFPGANLVKRRIYQDINLWQQQRGQWLIHDLHNQEFKRAETLSPGWAVVETSETWDLWLRDVKTGVKTGRKTSAIQVRYYLARQGNRWIVADFEVFGKDEDLPAINEGLL